MRGIYLNCEVPAEVHDIGAPEPDGCKLTFECGDNTLHLVGCNDIYFVEKDGYQMFLSGWAYTNRSIRPGELFRFFQNNSLNEIATGNLIAVVYNQETEKFSLFNDPFALSNHYFCKEETGRIRLSPCLNNFEDQPENKLWSGFNGRQGYVPGNHTPFSTVRRMGPATLIDEEGAHHKYCDPYVLLANGEVGDVGPFILKLSGCWEEHDRYISARDSFMQQVLVKFARSDQAAAPLAFTERNAARQKQHRVAKTAYRLRQLLGARINDSEIEFPLQVANRLSHDAAGIETTFFTDYLWDVLVKPYEVRSSVLAKLRNGSNQDKAQERLFKAMYPELSAEDRSQLLAEFQRYTSHLQLSETQKLSYFDALYGKTARSAQLTEQVLPNQFYRSVPVIAHRQIFSLLLQEDLSKATRKQVLERLLL